MAGPSSRCSCPPSSSRTTSPLPPSSPRSSGSSSRTMRSNTSSATTTTTSPRPTSPRPTPTSTRTARSTTRSTGCGSATSALLARRDVIVVASVSCIYGIGSPEDYAARSSLTVGHDYDRRAFLGRLIDMQYARNDTELVRGNFRVRGDVFEVHPAYEELALRIELFGDEVERMTRGQPRDGRDARANSTRSSSSRPRTMSPATSGCAAPSGIEVELQERLPIRTRRQASRSAAAAHAHPATISR